MQLLNGGQWKLLEEYVEIESGKRKDRPRLGEALKACKKHRATLIIAKLDRLARNVHFISGLMESGIEFVAVDNPHANKLMLHMLAAFAEHEREQIGRRTKEALTAAKFRGVKLGTNGLKLAEKNKNQSKDFYRKTFPIISALRAEGNKSFRSIAIELNLRGVPTYYGKGKWHPSTVHKLLSRKSQYS